MAGVLAAQTQCGWAEMGTCPSSTCWDPLPAASRAPSGRAVGWDRRTQPLLKEVTAGTQAGRGPALPSLDVPSPAPSNTSNSPAGLRECPEPHGATAWCPLPQHPQMPAWSQGCPHTPRCPSPCGDAGQPFPSAGSAQSSWPCALPRIPAGPGAAGWNASFARVTFRE